VRKLLVASQKSGVGKTTTSINLAAATAMSGARVLLVEADPLSAISSALNLGQHPEKRQLRTAGIDLPGILFCGVVPGLDVFSPYEEGGCSDEDLDRVLQFLSLDAFRESYDCLVVNAPPFLGGRPGELLASCEDFIVVMQAEPLAYRTMPAFMELVQRAAQTTGRAAILRGLVLTLPESEAPGGRWERELRGRFGKSILGHVVPYDEEVGKANLFGHVVVHASPETAASLAYQDLSAELQLTRDASGASARPAEATLMMAAAAVKANPLVARATPKPAFTGRKSSARMPRFRPPEPVGLSATKEKAAVPPPVVERPAAGPRHPAAPAPEPVAQGPVEQSPVREIAPALPLHSSPQPWLLWIGLAVVAGVGLRFVKLPSFVLPIVVGVAVTAGVTLALHLMTSQQEQERAAQKKPNHPPERGRPDRGKKRIGARHKL
jgi:chromosome partitioning protein